jgi:hypothetical protein
MPISNSPATMRTSYQQWQAAEGLPVVSGFYIEDLRTVEVQPRLAACLPGARDVRALEDVDPVGGEELERLVDELFRLDPAVAAKLKGLLR